MRRFRLHALDLLCILCFLLKAALVNFTLNEYMMTMMHLGLLCYQQIAVIRCGPKLSSPFIWPHYKKRCPYTAIVSGKYLQNPLCPSFT